jgi:hypothetical protein
LPQRNFEDIQQTRPRLRCGPPLDDFLHLIKHLKLDFSCEDTNIRMFKYLYNQ